MTIVSFNKHVGVAGVGSYVAVAEDDALLVESCLLCGSLPLLEGAAAVL